MNLIFSCRKKKAIMLSSSRNIFLLYAIRYQTRIFQKRSLKMKISPYIRKYETLDGKSQRRKLPISPDFGVYQPQLTTILSISHRLSGLALVGYVNFLGLNAIFGKHEFSELITMVEGFQLNEPVLFVCKYLFAFPFAFHACLGIRHLIWDCGHFLTIKGVYLTGYTACLSAIVLSGILAKF